MSGPRNKLKSNYSKVDVLRRVCNRYSCSRTNKTWTCPSAAFGYSISAMTLDDILLEAEEKMMKTEEVVQHEFAGVRTGKASPGLVENLMVEAYGSHMRLRELAGITTPEPRMLLIQPWDAGTIHPIEKAIQKSNLSLNPAIQGK